MRDKVAKALYEHWVHHEGMDNAYVDWYTLPDKESWLSRADAAIAVVIQECAKVAEQYEHAWGEGNNAVCGLVAADIRALAD